MLVESRGMRGKTQQLLLLVYVLEPTTKSFPAVLFLFFLFAVDFVIHWNETAKGLHVFPIPIPPPTSLSTRSL